MRDKRILFVGSFSHLTSSDVKGGQQRMCDSIYSILRDLEWNIFLLDTTTRTTSKRLFLERLLYSLRRVCVFVYALIRFKPQVILVFSASGFSLVEKSFLLYIAKFLSNAKRILSIRDGKWYSSNYRFSTTEQRWLKKCVDIYMCQLPYQKRVIESRLEKGISVEIVPNWTSEWQYVSYHGKSSNSSNRATIEVLYLGWLTVEKGAEQLYDIIKGCRSRDIHFTIVGQGPYEGRFLELTKEIGIDITLKGWIENVDLVEYYRKSDLLIQPSHFEGMSNVVLEAISFSLPVLCTDLDSFYDILGDSGFYFEAGDANQAVHFLMQKNLKELLISQRSIVQNRFIQNFNSEQSKNNFIKLIE